MAFYGEPLNSGYDPIRDNIYPLFTQYFENPRMVKIKDVEQYSMYIIKIHALLGIEFRYLIVFVPKNELPIGDSKFLAQLEWQSLQTMTLTNEYDVPFYSYQARRFPPLDKKIFLKKKNNSKYSYNVEGLPLEITLLPTNTEYNQTGNIITALETYQTIVTFT